MKNLELIFGTVLFILSGIGLTVTFSNPHILESLTFQHYLGLGETLASPAVAAVYLASVSGLVYGLRCVLVSTGFVERFKTKDNLDAGCFIRMMYTGFVAFILTLVTLGISGSVVGLFLLVLLSCIGLIEEKIKPASENSMA
jgi:hypothetical protein